MLPPRKANCSLRDKFLDAVDISYAAMSCYLEPVNTHKTSHLQHESHSIRVHAQLDSDGGIERKLTGNSFLIVHASFVLAWGPTRLVSRLQRPK